MTRPALRQLGVPTNYPPLPAAWDGKPIKWDPWQRPLRTSIDFIDVWECAQCDLPTGAWVARGYDTNPLGTPTFINYSATRCGWCGHTEVYQHDTKELWVLDETDYGPDGSHITADTLF